jgi:putative acetyltransferase
MRSIYFIAVAIMSLVLQFGCRSRNPDAGQFAIKGKFPIVTLPSSYPLAVDLDRLGTYPAETKSGAGYFYDDVLEYRVWLHPEKGASPLNGDHDYFYVFAQYEKAEVFSKASIGAEEPLVLVRQLEWIDEPEPGKYITKKGERITEWQVEWLRDDKRGPNSIAEFMRHPRPVKVAGED